MLRFMLVEQVLHIMQNQDYPRFLCLFSTANICIFALRYIRESEKYGVKVMQTFVKPSLYKITKKTVINKSVLKLNSVAGGGFAISILAQ